MRALLDEITEFGRKVLDSLRQPNEDVSVTIVLVPLTGPAQVRTI